MKEIDSKRKFHIETNNKITFVQNVKTEKLPKFSVVPKVKEQFDLDVEDIGVKKYVASKMTYNLKDHLKRRVARYIEQKEMELLREKASETLLSKMPE